MFVLSTRFSGETKASPMQSKIERPAAVESVPTWDACSLRGQEIREPTLAYRSPDVAALQRAARSASSMP